MSAEFRVIATPPGAPDATAHDADAAPAGARSGPLKLHWCRKCGGGSNLGDILGPLLLGRYGVEVEWARPDDADLLCVGSILNRVPDGWTGTVLGSGFIQGGVVRDLSRARVLAVRGVLSREAGGLPSSTPLGDPGILVDELLPDRPVARRGALIVPHYVDRRMRWRHLRARSASITDEPRNLLWAIASAELVYTSSLHGLIAADALGVPHVLEPHGHVKGGLFKFEDYASAFGDTIRPGVPRLTDRGVMAARQAELRGIFRSLADEVRQSAGRPMPRDGTEHRPLEAAAAPAAHAPEMAQPR